MSKNYCSDNLSHSKKKKRTMISINFSINSPGYNCKSPDLTVGVIVELPYKPHPTELLP